ncbi:MAG: hypothetical protein AVDCRST_MAG77-879 [uncultured Chloroflexi bacterium]|uniref:Uncharacterized protein n=1 Tax=uncultured Chloroflexota bacterium TaxID=166587 RepID=A0A6J4HMW3_9CHLR|nr:MAG: hypothetical protein AVDCRST_MAG77-879 [uncultured Chloroflexota bacterium]
MHRDVLALHAAGGGLWEGWREILARSSRVDSAVTRSTCE